MRYKSGGRAYQVGQLPENVLVLQQIPECHKCVIVGWYEYEPGVVVSSNKFGQEVKIVVTIVGQVVFVDERELGHKQHCGEYEEDGLDRVGDGLPEALPDFPHGNHVHEGEEGGDKQEVEELREVQARMVVGAVPHC